MRRLVGSVGLRCVILALLATAITSTAAFAQPAATADSLCRVGDALLSEGFLDRAEEVFARAVEDSPTNGCGQAGLRDVAAARAEGVVDSGVATTAGSCAAADALIGSGRLDGAEAILLEASKAGEPPACVTQLLESIDAVRDEVSIADLDEIPMVGTNFLPSFMQPWFLGFAIVGAAMALGGVIWVVGISTRPGSATDRTLGWLLSIIGVAVIAFSGAAAFHDEDPLNDSPCCDAVRVHAIPLAAGSGASRTSGLSKTTLPPTLADGETVGVVVSPRGDQGSVIVEDGSLTVDGVTRAGAYDGKADLVVRSGGPVKVSLDVRDWGPYGVVAVALGVVIGWVLHRYFGRERTRRLLRIRVLETWAKTTDQESWFAAEGGSAAAQLSIKQSGSEVITRLLRSLQDPTTENSTIETDLKNLEAVAIAVSALQREVVALLETLRDWTGMSSANAFAGATPPSNPDVDKARRLLQTKIDTPNLPAVEVVSSLRTQVVEWSTKLGTALVHLRQAARSYDAIAVALTEIGDPPKAPWTDATAKQARDLAATGRASARDVYRSPTDKTTEKWAVFETAANAFDAHRRSVLGGGSPALERSPSSIRATVAPARPRHPGQEPWPLLSCRVISIEGVREFPSPADGRTDDLFVFSIDHVPVGRSVAVIIEGTRIPIESPTDDARPPVLAHRFRSPGDWKIFVEVDEDSKPAFAVRIEPATSLEGARGELRGRDAMMTLLASAVAVGSGMLVLYVQSPAWGSAGDYLKALLWGSTVAEGLKWAANLVTSKLPTA